MRTALFLFVLAFAACKKDVQPVPADDRIDVSRITTVDYNGSVMGPVDPDDWTYDSTWSPRTLSLLETPSAADLAGADSAEIRVFPARPNPCDGNFQWGVIASRPTRVQVVITNDRLQVLQRHSFPVSQSGWQGVFQLAENNFPSGTYRLHYAFYNAQGRVYFKGHGDLRVVR